MTLLGVQSTKPAALDGLALADLVSVNKPTQFGLVEQVVAVLSAGPAVTDLLVRGSLARGTADRMSDIDFVVGVCDDQFATFVEVLDTLMTASLGAILPGWLDTIVAPMGGLGFVYLIQCDGALHQLDLYVAPASRIDEIEAATAAHRLLHRGDAPRDLAARRDAARFVAGRRSLTPTCGQLLIEVLVLGQMIAKRLTRGQTFIAYAESHLLNTAVKNLIKVALAPASAFYGWYQLPDEVGRTPIGRACLRDLGALIAAPAVPTADTLTDALHRVVRLAERVDPDTVAELRTAIDAYWHYLDLA